MRFTSQRLFTLYCVGFNLWTNLPRLTTAGQSSRINNSFIENEMIRAQCPDTFLRTVQKPIECVHLTSSNSQIQNKRATKGFVLIRHNRYQIYTCSSLQLSSSIASFVWKPAQFELRSYGGAWHNTKIAFVEKYTLISWFFANLGVYVSGKVLF